MSCWFGFSSAAVLDFSARSNEEDTRMAKIVTCRDVGVDCDFVAKGETEQEVLKQCAEHARTAHGMTELPSDLATKVRGAIRDEAA